MALVNPCAAGATRTNTGTECSDAMRATAMLIMMPKASTWTATDEEDFTSFVKTKIHADAADRWYPIFGNPAPVRGIVDNNEQDVLETLEDGSVQFIRFGMYNRMFLTTEGGLCLAKALGRLNKNYSFIEIDIEGKILRMVNPSGTRQGVPVNLAYSPTPELANLKTTYKNKFYLSFSKNNYIDRAEIVVADANEDILALNGLIDSQVYQRGAYTNSGATAATGGYTIVKGSTNDTIDVQVSGVSISGGPVIQTVSESTDTLLAAKVKAAINAATATNGGYSANNTAGALTLTAPTGLGASINTVQATAVIVGGITTTTPVAFSGGVTGTAVLKVGVKTNCGETDLVTTYGNTLGAHVSNFDVEKDGTTPVTPSLASQAAGVVSLTVPFLNGSYEVNLASAATLKAAGIEGYDGVLGATIVVLN